jgi:hypothetical protein
VVERLATLCGGWERVGEHLSDRQAAATLVKLLEDSAELHRRAEQAAARASMAVKDASRDPGCIQAAAQILKAAGWKIEPPG